MNSPGSSACAGTGRRLLTGALHHRLRQPVAEAEVVVGVVERRCRVEVEERQAAHAVGAGEQLVVLLDGSSALLVGRARTRSRSRADRRRPGRRPSARVRWRRCPRGCRPGPPCPSRNSSGKVCSDSSGTPSARKPFHVNASVTQRSELVHRGGGVRGGLRLVQQLGEPGPPAGRRVERQELVATRDGRRAGQQDVLDVVEFKHPARFTASGRACPRRPPSASAPS